MQMVEQSNPRTIHASGGQTVVSLPDTITDAHDIDLGDDMVWVLDDGVLSLRHVSYTVGGLNE